MTAHYRKLEEAMALSRLEDFEARFRRSFREHDLMHFEINLSTVPNGLLIYSKATC